jgi:plasmid stabilization system protein ParE
MGPQYPDDETGQVRTIVSGKYRIFYRVKESDNRVEIITVRHSSRRPLDASDLES